MDDRSSVCSDDDIAEVYQRHVDTVYRLCFMYLKNASDAEDAVQSVFLKLLKIGKKFADHEHEKAWLIVTAKNYCKDMLKSWWKFRRVRMDHLPELFNSENQEQANELMETLLALPPKYKDVLYLYYYEDYSVKDISAMLNRNESTIQSQLANGRKRLKVRLEGGIHHVRSD
ncbi:RNA polymerase sigma factor [Paenibacillus sp. NEAU-GSW1]|uniref:RNA polymerase sigma factor n=1 Tax=Paenibacillus sp. NEAU-GSW1 TaxID=2682486 RepID=UPI0012E2BCBE|nr:RNA polymerase sigma factor [Paenibacillus sp. NEAU-GSW1]MUT68354.1 sigma-70 family RNA polymerase sigma factor [Paenibacillus sp. NEAU-GSW1]